VVTVWPSIDQFAVIDAQAIGVSHQLLEVTKALDPKAEKVEPGETGLTRYRSTQPEADHESRGLVAQHCTDELITFHELAVQFHTQQLAVPINAALQIGDRHLDLTDALNSKRHPSSVGHELVEHAAATSRVSPLA
jgi:hypothetical protein